MTWNPYDNLPEVPSFKVTSKDFQEGEKFKLPQVSGIFGAGGEDTSPELSWSGFPAETQSFAITTLDPDAPSPTGFWHWLVVDIPAATTEVPAGSGDEKGTGLPAAAYQLPNDARLSRFLGAAPPPGSAPHRYIFVVHALDTATVGIDEDASPGLSGCMLTPHTLARAVISAWYQR